MEESRKCIYLDYASTTPIDSEVLAEMTYVMQNEYGNASSRTHSYGWSAETIINNSRKSVANLINADPKEIIFTSGATESNNLAIKGCALFNKDKGKHLITSKIEHKSVINSFRSLEDSGFEVDYLTPNTDGIHSIEDIKKAIRKDTTLISIMMVNNEIGVIQPIESLGQLCKELGIILHVDAAQAVGKIEVDVQKLNVGLLSISGHKIYGPKGIGALYIRKKPKIRIIAQIHGGGQERAIRSGTLANHQIAGLAKACEVAQRVLKEDELRITNLKNKLIEGLTKIDEVIINGSTSNRIYNNVNISFKYIEGESLLMAINSIAVSSGSACASPSLEPSYVLRALGLDPELAHSSLRISLGRYTTEDEIDHAIDIISKGVARLRDISPLWEMHLEGTPIKF